MDAPSVTYSGYLALDTLLASQRPLSDSHDELLFITIHQATELWMKLVLHELRAARALIARDHPEPAFKMMARVTRVQSHMTQSWDILSTLTPVEFLAFRPHLGQSSGLQSYQYRLIEFTLGNKNDSLLAPHRDSPEVLAMLEAAMAEPGLYDESIRLLARRGFEIAAGSVERDWRQPYRPDESVAAAWLAVYRDVGHHWDLYQLAEKLIDIETSLQHWRFHHLKTVERTIGHKRGTGGSAGAAYLRRVVDTRLFPELWDIRTAL